MLQCFYWEYLLRNGWSVDVCQQMVGQQIKTAVDYENKHTIKLVKNRGIAVDFLVYTIGKPL